MDAERAQLLIDTLAQKRDCCRRLLELSRKQRSLISDSQLSELMELLVTKHRVLGRLDEVQRNLGPLIPVWESRRDSFDSDARVRCDELLDETEKDLADLIDCEKQCEQGLEELRRVSLEQMRQTDDGRRLNQTYLTSAAGPTNRLVDLESG